MAQMDTTAVVEILQILSMIQRTKSSGAIFGQQMDLGRSVMMFSFHISPRTKFRKRDRFLLAIRAMTMRITLDQNLE